MNDYVQKIKILYEKFGGRKVVYEKSGIRPSRDWKIMLVTSFIATCFLAFYAIYFYMRVDRGEIFVVDKGTIGKDAEINSVLLRKIVSEIKNGQDFLGQLKTSNLAPPDPSI